MTSIPVVLVCMPWNLATRPSISLGILKRVLDGHGIPSVIRSFHLGFAEHLVRATEGDDSPLTLRDYEAIANDLNDLGAGDWIFAVSPYRSDDGERDATYLASLAGRLQPRTIDLMRRVRRLVPSFLDACVTEILASNPRIVGFTTTFCQNVPSLVLARMLKERDPDITIVMGGSNCEGPMGAALHRSFPWVDVVVRGEGERVFPWLVRRILDGEPLDERPGLCFRRDREIVACDEADPQVAMDEVPIPDYDEYFERLDGSILEAEIRLQLQLPYESARGCWWGAKHHCTFCGLNGASMRFRSKSPPRVLDELRTLSEEYRALDFFVVDNIIDMDYFGTVLPELARSGWDLTFFFETKANLRHDQIRQLHDAGVTMIQPGIESLSTPILKLMNKGVTALQNVRLLKWCATYRMDVVWNIIYGFPGEPADEYPRMADAMRALTHLKAPNPAPLRIDRFSPYFERREALGIRIKGPKPHYQYLYDVDPMTLSEIAYFFEAEHLDGRQPATYVGPVEEMIKQWNRDTAAGFRSLRYRQGPGFVVIDDQRPGWGPQRYKLDEAEAAIFLACEAGAKPAAIRRELAATSAGDVDEAEIRGFLDELVGAGLVYRENDQYLALAIADDIDGLHARIARAEAVPAPRPRPSLAVVQ